MRVLHVLSGPMGGASVGALEFMRTSRQAETGIEHFAVYPGVGGDPDPAVKQVCSACWVVPMRWWNQKTTLSPMRRLAVWGREMQFTWFGRRTRRLLRELVQEWRIDLIHTNNAAILDGAIVAAQVGIPHVWHIRERIGRDGYLHFGMNDKELVDYIASVSTTIVPMSRFIGKIFVRHGQAAKTRVVYDGVDPALFDTDGARRRGRELRRSWGVADSSLLVGNVGAVTAPGKRHDVFIRAAGILSRRNPSVRFAIIGLLPKATTWARRQGLEYFQRLRQLVLDEGITGRLVWADHVVDIGAVMNAIDILAHACDIEGFGRVAIEAMAAGKPVVGPAAGGFTESVVDGESGCHVQPGNAAAMAQAIEELIKNSDLRARFGQAGRERVQQHFSPEGHLRAMLDVYSAAMGKGEKKQLVVGEE